MRRRTFAGSWLGALGWLLCLVVLAAVVAGFWVAGGPAQARQERADAERVNDLENLTRAVRQYFVGHKVLPTSLDQASVAYASEDERRDPVTNSPYEYRVVDKLHFELCATFQTDQSKLPRSSYGYMVEALPFWHHVAGRQCFMVDAKTTGGP